MTDAPKRIPYLKGNEDEIIQEMEKQGFTLVGVENIQEGDFLIFRDSSIVAREFEEEERERKIQMEMQRLLREQAIANLVARGEIEPRNK